MFSWAIVLSELIKYKQVVTLIRVVLALCLLLRREDKMWDKNGDIVVSNKPDIIGFDIDLDFSFMYNHSQLVMEMVSFWLLGLQSSKGGRRRSQLNKK